MKHQQITADIEQRIRRHFYQDKLPANEILQNEYKVARQTITEALRPLLRLGILTSRSRRNGIQIDRKKLNYGKIIIVSYIPISSRESAIAKLMQEISRDGFVPELHQCQSLDNFKKIVSPQCRGFLFITSSLTVSISEYLQQQGIPFVSCNFIPDGMPGINVVDYDMQYSYRQIFQKVHEAGYRKIGLFSISRMEGYQEMSYRVFRKIKKEFNLPIEPYDKILLQRHIDPENALEKCFQLMARRKCFPEVVISFSDIRSNLQKIRKKGFPGIPGNLKIIFRRAKSSRKATDSQNLISFYPKESGWRKLLSGYALLREIMLNLYQKPVIRTSMHIHYLDNPIPEKQSV